MKYLIKASLVIIIAVFCAALLPGCGGRKLSAHFNEAEVKTAAESVVVLLNSGNAEGLVSISTVALQQALTEDVIDQIFAAIGEGGSFVEISSMAVGGSVDRASGEEYAVVVVRARYENKSFIYTITFSRQMKLAGLFYR